MGNFSRDIFTLGRYPLKNSEQLNLHSFVTVYVWRVPYLKRNEKNNVWAHGFLTAVVLANVKGYHKRIVTERICFEQVENGCYKLLYPFEEARRMMKQKYVWITYVTFPFSFTAWMHVFRYANAKFSAKIFQSK